MDKLSNQMNPSFARRLRLIAEHLKRDEDERVKAELKAGRRSVSRNMYHDDLIALAKMFEGTHRRYFLEVKKNVGGQKKPTSVHRDFRIAQDVQSLRDSGLKAVNAFEAVAKNYKHLDKKSIERAYYKMKKYLGMSEEARRSLLFFMAYGVTEPKAKTPK